MTTSRKSHAAGVAALGMVIILASRLAVAQPLSDVDACFPEGDMQRRRQAYSYPRGTGFRRSPMNASAAEVFDIGMLNTVDFNREEAVKSFKVRHGRTSNPRCGLQAADHRVAAPPN